MIIHDVWCVDQNHEGAEDDFWISSLISLAISPSENALTVSFTFFEFPHYSFIYDDHSRCLIYWSKSWMPWGWFVNCVSHIAGHQPKWKCLDRAFYHLSIVPLFVHKWWSFTTPDMLIKVMNMLKMIFELALSYRWPSAQVWMPWPFSLSSSQSPMYLRPSA